MNNSDFSREEINYMIDLIERAGVKIDSPTLDDIVIISSFIHDPNDNFIGKGHLKRFKAKRKERMKALKEGK